MSVLTAPASRAASPTQEVKSLCRCARAAWSRTCAGPGQRQLFTFSHSDISGWTLAARPPRSLDPM